VQLQTFHLEGVYKSIMSHTEPERGNRQPEGSEPEEPFPMISCDVSVFTEAERCPRCKGTGFIGKAVDVEGNPIEQPQEHKHQFDKDGGPCTICGKTWGQLQSSEQPQEYDDLLPVCLYQDKLGQWHLLDRHNDEIATFDPAIEKEDMERIVTAVNNAEGWLKDYQGECDTMERWKETALQAQSAIADRSTLIYDVKLALLSLVSDRLKIVWGTKFDKILAPVDLSALDKHDEELAEKIKSSLEKEWEVSVRKPLVDALETLADPTYFNLPHVNRFAADALAKEGK
jgi:hypothetical protein